MKLLGWMHRKFRQNSNETPKDFSIVYTGQQPSQEDLQYHPRGSCCRKSLSKSQRDNYHLRNSFASLNFDEEEEEEPSAALTELFHGFLAIGTLGKETIDPGTPTFCISVDHIAEKETQATENELKLINDELEKVLGADESCNASSGRNSHVSSVGRISHCSAITLSGKLVESAHETVGNEAAIICPLQNYLLGSAIGLPDTTAPPARKEQRTSLGELFQKTKPADENSGTKSEGGEKRMDKEMDKSPVHLMKKMLKRRIHASTRSSSAASGGKVDTATAEPKLHKIRHIFNRKVHPENSTLRQQSNKPNKKEIKNKTTHVAVAASNSAGPRPSAEDIIIYPHRAISNESIGSYKSQPHFPQLMKSSGDNTGNEFWVKTDADYLVLEL